VRVPRRSHEATLGGANAKSEVEQRAAVVVAVPDLGRDHARGQEFLLEVGPGSVDSGELGLEVQGAVLLEFDVQPADRSRRRRVLNARLQVLGQADELRHRRSMMLKRRDEPGLLHDCGDVVPGRFGPVQAGGAHFTTESQQIHRLHRREIGILLGIHLDRQGVDGALHAGQVFEGLVEMLRDRHDIADVAIEFGQDQVFKRDVRQFKADLGQAHGTRHQGRVLEIAAAGLMVFATHGVSFRKAVVNGVYPMKI
jgi:hypothetical protein